MSGAGAGARIAMWSGPRTVSTAMMRAWENRPDTVVADEPLYAFYLSSPPGLGHPGRDEVIASQPTGWQAVLSALASGPLPPGVTIAYARHMTHHVLPQVDLAAFAPFRHAFLIRDPRSLLASYARVRSAPALDDLGLRQQAALFEAFGVPVIDAADLLAAPEAGLRVMLDHRGFIAETNATHIFMVLAADAAAAYAAPAGPALTLATPTTASCPEGITRGAVLSLAASRGLPVAVGDYTLPQPYNASEAFVTGTMGGLVPVVAVDGRRIGDGSAGPVTKQLTGRYADLVASSGTVVA